MIDFEYIKPTKLSDAKKLLGELKSNAKILAGGTDLVDQIRTKKSQPKVLIDLKSIPELQIVKNDNSQGLRIGAALPLIKLQQNESKLRTYPGLLESIGLIGSVQTQNRATLGGNIGNASPSADTVPILIALSTIVLVNSEIGSRKMLLEEIFNGPGSLILEEGEFIQELIIPFQSGRSANHYMRFTPRAEMDIAVVGVGASVLVSDDGIVQSVKIGLGAVAPIPTRSLNAEDFLKGKLFTLENIEQACEILYLDADPISDIRGSKEYRLELLKVICKRVLVKCAESLV